MSGRSYPGGFGEMPPGLYPGRQMRPSTAAPVGLAGGGRPQVIDPPAVPVVQRGGVAKSVFLITNAVSIMVLQANLNRKYLAIQNNGTGNPATGAAIRGGFGQPADLFSWRIVVDGFYEPPFISTDSIWILGESATAQQVVILEG